MEEGKSSAGPQPDCCAGSPAPGGEKGSTETCGCCGSPPRRSWLRTLVFLIVILAAIGVGAYSIFVGSAKSPAGAASAADAATSARTAENPQGPTLPVEAAPACCSGGGSGAGAVPPPAEQTTCGGGAPPAPCCGGN